MYKKIKVLNDIVINYSKEKNININDYNIEDCLKLLKVSKVLECFNRIFKDINSVNEKDISFCSDFVIDLIKIYLDNNNIEIIEEDFVHDYKDRRSYDNNLKIYLNDISKYPLLSMKKEKELIKDYKENNNQKSKDIIICSNQKLILKYASKKTDDDNFLLDLI